MDPSSREPVPPSGSVSFAARARGPGEATAVDLPGDMARRWAAGERPRVEDYLAADPSLADDTDAVLDLAYEEFCLRQQHGEGTDPEALLARFPRWRDALQRLLDCHRLLADGGAAPALPGAGDVVGDFRLLAQLGSGARARIFLAAQESLADRPVVVKVVPLDGHAAHLSLARLQHTHIVPLYAVQDDTARGVRLLCMPYFGSAT